MAHRQYGFTRASSLGPIASFVLCGGGSISRVFHRADLPIKLIEAPQTLVPLKEQFRLLHQGAREMGDAEFGARLGQNVRAQNLGAYGCWAASAPDLEAALIRAAQGLNTMLQTSTALKLSRVGAYALWSIELFDAASEGRYQHELLALSYMLDIVRLFAGRNWSPDLILTTGPKGAKKGELELLYRAPVLTGQPVSAIKFDCRVLACRTPRRLNTLFRSAACGYAEPPIPGEEDGPAAVAALTALSLLNGYPRLDWVASKLGLTRRSLQRKLSGRGATFAQLVERSLRERAETLLAQRDVPLTAIAFELGYSDPAHFSRAFKKWTGITPSARRAIGIQS